MSLGFGFALPAYPLRGGGGNNPFNQLGPTLDLSFVDGATNVGNQLGADTYTLDTNFITPQYQVAAQYAVWVDGSGMTQRNFADIVTFTRGSNATQFDSTGSLVYAPANLLTWSEDFGNAAWNKGAVNVATNSTTAPDNSLSADTITETTATDQHLVGASIAGGVFIGQVITLSCFVKIATGTRNVFFTAFGEGYSVFNPSTGAVIQTGGNTCTAISYGNGWWRFSATITKTNTNAGVFIGLWNGTNNYTGDGTSGLFIWGAQTSLFPTLGGITSSLTTYYPTTTTAYYGPRFDYNPSTLAAQGLLIEEQRTNSIRNNTMQGAVAGTPGTLPTNWSVFTSLTGLTRTLAVGTENGIAYLDIRLNGTPSAAGDYQWFEETTTQIAASSGQTWTHSAYYKLQAGTMNGISDFQIAVQERDAVGGFLGGTFTTQTTPSATTLRGAVTRTLNQATTAFVFPGFRFVLTGAAIDVTLRIGLPQLEQGAFATSVIPTTTTALTRSADVASVNTLSPWWNASEGTFYVEGSAGSLANSPIFVMPHDGTSNNYLNSPLLTTAGLARLAGAVGGAAWTNVNTANSTTANTTFKSASAFKAGDQAICLNAGTVATGVNASVPVVTTVKLGDWRTSGNSINGYLRRIVYYPRRLPNADLQTITT